MKLKYQFTFYMHDQLEIRMGISKLYKLSKGENNCQLHNFRCRNYPSTIKHQHKDSLERFPNSPILQAFLTMLVEHLHQKHLCSG
jgi:hypothetical protein